MTTNKTHLKALTICRILFFAILLNLLGSCDFNYPDTTEKYIVPTTLNFHFETGTQSGTIDFVEPMPTKGKFQVLVYPIWIKPGIFEGNTIEGHSTIPFSFINVDNYTNQGVAVGEMVIKTSDKSNYRVFVSYGSSNVNPPNGEAFMTCNVAELELKIGETRSFTIGNPGQVEKWFYLNNLPSWLQISQTSGNLRPHSELTLQCTVNQQGLIPGEYSQIINIESTNPQLSTGILIKLTVKPAGPPVNSKSLKWFDGTLKDALYCKKTNFLYLLTKSPNSLIVKRADSDSLQVYPLDKTPNCIDVTAGGDTIVIGYNQAIVDLFNARTIEKIRTYETDCIPFDIVFGDNGWCYLAPDKDQWVKFFSLNLKNGKNYSTTNQLFYEKTTIRKMPGQPFLYTWGSGLSIINIEKGVPNEIIPRWLESSGGNIWLSADGKKMFGGYKTIYRTPEYNDNTSQLQNLLAIGTIDIPQQVIQTLDICQSQKCLYAVGSDYFWSAYNASTIYQINETSYASEKSMKVKPYPGILNNQYNPDMDVSYVFSNSEGTKLYALKNVKYDLKLDVWAIEILDLPFK